MNSPNRVERLERRIDQKLRQVLRSSAPDQELELVEVHRAILEEVASRVETLPKGKLSFDYSHLKVCILVAEPERRPSYELVFVDRDALARDIVTYFEERGIGFPSGSKVDIELVDSLPLDLKGRGFEVTYSKARDPQPNLQPIDVQLTVLLGNAEKPQYCFNKHRINIGRMAEVVDSDLRLLRRNDLSFADDSSPTNASVSRTHAHIEYDAEVSGFRLFDDGSAHGTIVVRDASVISVPRGASKGVLLQPGDELILGKAQIRFDSIQV